MTDPSKSTLVFLVISTLLLAVTPLPEVTGEDGWEPDHVITWSPDEGPIVIDETVDVDETTRLIIEAGVEVRFDPDTGINVKGHLRVEGTEGEPVMFTPNTTGPVVNDSWEGISLLSESTGRSHRVDHAMFQGAHTGLLVSSAEALVQDCTFDLNRYGMLARGIAEVEVRVCRFTNNSVLGLEFETGADGLVVDCEFEDNVVGIFCYKGSDPQIVNCVFRANYHHISFSGSNGTVRSCTLRDAIAEAFECYDHSSPLLIDVIMEGLDDDGIHVRNASRPRMVGGTPVSQLGVDSKDNASYAIAMAWITVEVRDDDGKRLVEANVTLNGASGMTFSQGSTDDEGRLEEAMMSMYTLDSSGGLDRENPHMVNVEWRGHEQTFRVDPRDLDNDRVLKLEMDIGPPEPGGWGFIPNVLLLILISVIAISLAWWYTQRR